MIELPSDLFNHMATPKRASIKLHPPTTETRVQEYLEALSSAVGETTITPDSGLQAIVFGEWGHGKSQVLYRTADHLTAQHDDVLTITIISAEMDAEGVLRAARQQFTDSAPAGLSVLDRTTSELGRVKSESDAMQCVARGLAAAAQAAARRHSALLFDEVQTMDPDVFQDFLWSLRTQFRKHDVCLHTLQCHSLSSIDAAQTIAQRLGEWLTRGRKIQLPSISPDHASDFYRQRILDFGGTEELADQLVPSGIAQTLCEMAGGNPRLMLTLGKTVASAMNRQGESRFEPATVLRVLTNIGGPEAGTRLFDERRYNAIVDLLPQEWPDCGHAVVQWLDAEFPKLFVARQTYTPPMLFKPPLSLNAQTLRQLHRNIDGVPLLSVETDEELGITEYSLSDQLRERLSNPWGSSGSSVDQKDAQFGLVISPHRYQRDINVGVLQLLQLGGFAPRAHLETLGNAETGEPLSGHRFLARVTSPDDKQRLNLFVPVLVTNLFGGVPSNSWCKAVRDGLLSGRWARVFVFFYHPKYTWDQWIDSSEAEERLGCAQQIVALGHADWSRILPATVSQSGLPEEPGVKALRFFAELHAARRVDPGAPSESQRSFANQVTQMVRERHVGLSDLAYVPDDQEWTLLSTPDWTSPRSLGELEGRWTQKDLAPLRGQFLEKEGNRWIRLPLQASPLYNATLETLKKAKKPVPPQEIAQRVERSLLLADTHKGRLPAAVKRCLDALVDRGLAQKGDPGGLQATYEYLDLKKENRSKKQNLKQEVKLLTKRAKELQRYGAQPEFSSNLLAELSSIDEALKRKCESPAELKRLLSDLEQHAQQHRLDLEKAESETWKLLAEFADDMRGRVHDLQLRRTSLPESLVNVVFEESAWKELGSEVDYYAKRLEESVSSQTLPRESSHEEVIREYSFLKSKLNDAEAYLSGDRNVFPGKRGDLLKQLLTARSEPRITVYWKAQVGSSSSQKLADLTEGRKS